MLQRCQIRVRIHLTERHESKGKPLTEGHSAEAQLMRRIKLSDLLRILM